MYEFKIGVTRDGRWWMVHIPEIDGLTQARRLSEVETMAREYIALDRNLPFDEIQIETASVRIEEPAFRELLETAREIKSLRAKANELERQAAEKRMSTPTCSPPTAYQFATSPNSSTSRLSESANSQLLTRCTLKSRPQQHTARRAVRTPGG